MIIHPPTETAVAQPKIDDLATIGMVALTVIILAYSTHVGMLAILVFYAMWLPQLILRSKLVFHSFFWVLFTLALPLFSAYSFFWSRVPTATLYSGTQFITMVLATVIAMRCCTLAGIIRGLVVGCTLVLLMSLAKNNYHEDYFTGEYSLVGLFGSKNQIGLYADIGIISSVLLFFTSNLKERLLLVLPGVVIGFLCLYLSRSAGSLVALSATLTVLLATNVLMRLKQPIRGIAMFFGFGILILGAIFISLHNLNIQGAALQGLGKDTTLTGRTYLWGEAIKIAQERPLLGYGYAGFWTHGQPLAEKFWAEFKIANRTGFHFHNMYFQTLVDMGIAGVSILISLMITNLIMSIRYLFRTGINLTSMYIISATSMIWIRAMTEVDFLGQYNIGTFLAYSVIPLLTEKAGRK